MLKKVIGVALLTMFSGVVACSSDVHGSMNDAGIYSDSGSQGTNKCSSRTGVFQFSYKQLAGDCDRMPDVIIDTYDPPQIDCVDKTITSNDACTENLDAECKIGLDTRTNADLYELTKGKVVWNTFGSSASGVITVIIFVKKTSVVRCSGTYNVSVTKISNYSKKR